MSDEWQILADFILQFLSADNVVWFSRHTSDTKCQNWPMSTALIY